MMISRRAALRPHKVKSSDAEKSSKAQEWDEMANGHPSVLKNWLSGVLGMDESAAKNALEAHIKERCETKSEAERKFKSDIWRFVVYTAFIVLFSISASTSGQEILNVRNLVQPKITDFSSIAAVTDIYTYLETVIIPAVSSGGLFSLSGNVMMTPVLIVIYMKISCTSLIMMCLQVIVRMLKVKQVPVKFPANATGGSTLTYPIYSEEYKQSSNGGGTWTADDPTDIYPDWPENESWSTFTKCVGGSSRCYVSDSNALRPGVYPRDGYVVTLNGTSDDMMATVARLRAAGFLDPNATRAVFVEVS
jgi:hypothetical protein